MSKDSDKIKGIKAGIKMREMTDKLINHEPVSEYGDTRVIDKVIRDQEKDIDREIVLAEKIRKAELAGVNPEIIRRLKQRSGVNRLEVPGNTQNVSQFQQMLAMKITQAETPEEKTSLLQMSQMLTNDAGQVNNPAFMAAIMGNQSRKTNTESKLNDEIMKKMLDLATQKPEKVDELALFDKMTSIVQKVQGMTASPDTVDDLLKNVEAYKKLGIVKDNSDVNDVEKLKIGLEKEKINKDFELEKMKVEQEGSKYENLSKVGGDVVGSIISAFVTSQDGEEQNTSAIDRIKKTATSSNGYKATCEKCKKQMMITDVKNSRTIACPNCDQAYELDGNTSKLYMVTDNQSQTLPGPDPESKGGSPTDNLKA